MNIARVAGLELYPGGEESDEAIVHASGEEKAACKWEETTSALLELGEGSRERRKG